VNARELYKEYGAGSSIVEYGYCIDGKIISIKETIEISERMCTGMNDVERCKKCTLPGSFP
jgi:hypothetical protein